jgi:hypothetical protein
MAKDLYCKDTNYNNKIIGAFICIYQIVFLDLE